MGACGFAGGLEGEEEQASRDLPEHLLGHEHVGPLQAGVVHGGSDRRVECGNQAHPLELWDQVAPPQYAVSFYVYPPVSSWPPFCSSVFRILVEREGLGRGRLVEVPVEGDPQDHCDLAGRGGGWLEVGGGGVRYGGDIEAIVLQGGLREGVDVGSASDAVLLLVGAVDHHGVVIAGLAIVLGVDYNGPPYRERRLVILVELMALKEEAGEDGLDGECLAIGQADRGGRGHCVLRDIIPACCA